MVAKKKIVLEDEVESEYNLSLLRPKKKKKINSRTKGNRFENKIAKMLNERFKTEEFCRSPGSGAFATTHKLPEYMKIYGDLITPINFKFTLEMKKGYNKESLCEIFNPKSDLRKMIVQAIRDSVKSSKDFILVIGQDRKDPVVITRMIILERIKEFVVLRLGEEIFYLYQLKDVLALPDSYFFSVK